MNPVSICFDTVSRVSKLNFLHLSTFSRGNPFPDSPSTLDSHFAPDSRSHTSEQRIEGMDERVREMQRLLGIVSRR